MSQYPPGPPPQNPGGGPPPGQPPQPGWGAPQPPNTPPGFPPQQPQQPPPGYGQPQPGSGGYGQQPYPPAMPVQGGGGGGNGAKILIGLAVLAVLGVGAFFVMGGGSDSSSDRSPSETVEAFVAASKDADCEKLMGLITEESWNDGGDTSREDALKECKEESSGEGAFPEDTKISDIKTTSEDESSATVSATIESAGDSYDAEIPLVKEDGSWRIQLGAIGSGSSDDGGEIPDDDGDVPEDFDSDDTVPEFDPDDLPDDLGDLPDIPECDYESTEFDADACADAVLEGGG